MSWFPKKCVVVPIDFSPASNVAVRTALSLVDSPKQVHVVHVAMVPQTIPYGESVWAAEPGEWMKKATKHLSEYIASHPEFTSVTFATLTGESDEAIVKYSVQHHADLIVMPCHGLRGIKRMLLGSVTEKVLRYASCEVLVQRFPNQAT
jgi:nucleotide-binding universal stress UspA family protein